MNNQSNDQMQMTNIDDPAIKTVGSVIRYVSDKNEGLRFVTGINCTPEGATKKMVYTRKMFGEKGNRVLWHGYQSFAPGESTPEQVHRMGVELAEKLWGDRFEVVVATHLDRAHLHNHMVINATSFIDGKKFNWDKEYPRMQRMSDMIAVREGCSTLAINSEDMSMSDNPARKGYTIEKVVREDIDTCIEISNSLEEWEELMRKKGYMIDNSRKYLRIYPYGHSKCIRVDRRFGDDYTHEGIERRILERVMDHPNTQFEDNESEDDRYTLRPPETELEPGSESKFEKEFDAEIERESEAEPGKDELSDDEYVTALYHALKTEESGDEPKGIQVVYLRFIVGMGTFYKSHGRIARIHYLYREELIKLDKYIDESRYLIRNDISTEDELDVKYLEEKKALDTLKESRKDLQNMLRSAQADERESIQEELQNINHMIREDRKNIRICESIKKRTGDMLRRKEMVNNNDIAYSETREYDKIME
ncbi:MAG: relaxase/mobilization nuclease domain-containing protein [Eubacterium sp.]|nr:relaxase/mobilization nuclease domain-containing protein [Eubacterium sp.]